MMAQGQVTEQIQVIRSGLSFNSRTNSEPPESRTLAMKKMRPFYVRNADRDMISETRTERHDIWCLIILSTNIQQYSYKLYYWQYNTLLQARTQDFSLGGVTDPEAMYKLFGFADYVIKIML
jgi:hypothetical protein